jgi:hypothetical protein
MTDQTSKTSSRGIPIPSHTPIGVIGAGTMGSGIAQVAAVAGHLVKIFDTGLVIEAIAENLCRKQEVLRALEKIVAQDCLRYRTSPLIQRSFWSGRRLDEATN